MTWTDARATSTQCHGGHGEIDGWLERQKALGTRRRPVVCALSRRRGAISAGLYNVAADVPHTQPVYWLLETPGAFGHGPSAGYCCCQTTWMMRAASQRVQANTRRCAAVVILRRHEANGDQPGPIPPRAASFGATDLTPAEQFWVIKHGVKMTGHASLGRHPRDELLWDVVAFVRKLPELTAEQYESAGEERSETRGADARNGNGRPRTKRGPRVILRQQLA